MERVVLKCGPYTARARVPTNSSFELQSLLRAGAHLLLLLQASCTSKEQLCNQTYLATFQQLRNTASGNMQYLAGKNGKITLKPTALTYNAKTRQEQRFPLSSCLIRK